MVFLNLLFCLVERDKQFKVSFLFCIEFKYVDEFKHILRRKISFAFQNPGWMVVVFPPASV